jgi:aryl-alcohol dehydrogenase-like predicted oxidoreductase
VTTIPRRTLGRTGFEASVLGYGAFDLRGGDSWGGRPVSNEEAERLLNAVLDVGINIIDTSIDYGLAEDFMGRFIAHRRDEYFLTNKMGCVPGREGEHNFTATIVRQGVEQSLRRLRTDYLDLVQFHLSLTRLQMEEGGALEEAMKLKEEGKVRFIGSSGWLPNIHQQLDMKFFDVFQIPYSALQREHEEIISMAAATGAGTLIRGGVAKGAPDGGWERALNYMVGPDLMRQRWQEARLDELLDGMSRIEFMLRFTLSHPDLDTVLIGTKNPQHLTENIEVVANKGPLPEDLLTEAKRRLDAVGGGPMRD